MQSIRPVLLGPAARPRFGCLHTPTGNMDRHAGVMLVNPLGHEYIRNHRAFRILADRLAFKGFTVLRFDFLGTGDSWGNLEDVGFADWLEDLHLA
ncbi:MAG: hypothetical protein ACYSU1_06140, partial [Planctomycetota bacterium]